MKFTLNDLADGFAFDKARPPALHRRVGRADHHEPGRGGADPAVEGKARRSRTEDLSDNLVVQLGVVTEALNRSWYERNTGRSVTDVSAGSSIR